MCVLAPHAEGLAEGWVEEGVEVRTFRYAPPRWELLGYGRSLQADERPAIAAAAVTPLYLLGARRAVKRALAEGRWDVVQAHWIVPNLFPALVARKSAPVVVGLHGSDVFMAEKGPVRAVVRRSLRHVQALTSCSPELAARIQRIGFPAERSFVIPYGVDSALFAPDPERRSIWRNRLGIPGGATVALGVGRMATKKGFQLLIEALPRLMQEHAELHLVLAGGGDRLAEFQQAAAAFSTRVHFPGAVLHDTLPDLYRAADLFVLPAVHDAKGNVDGLPNVILEAMATGLPIVGSRISGLPIAVTEGENGWLIEEGDVAGLCAAMAEALADRARLERLGSRSRERASRDFSWESVAARYRNAYVAAGAGRQRSSGG